MKKDKMEENDRKEEDKFIAPAEPTEDDSREWKPFWVRFRAEPEYRQQFLDSICMWAGFFVFVSMFRFHFIQYFSNMVKENGNCYHQL